MGRKRKSVTRRKLAGTYKPIQLVSLEERLAEEREAQGEFAVIQAAMDAAEMPEEGNPIDAYAAAVCAGEIPAGRLHLLSCLRHQRDRDREKTAEFPYRLNFAKVARFLAFSACLKHYKGEWAGKVIELQPYQVFRLGSLMGWEHVETGLRRFRTSYNEVPRKNGKSLEAAIVLLYLTFFDGEPGAEGICAATKTGQAQIVFNDCARLVRASGLRAYVNVFAHNLHNEETASKLEPISADSKTTDGLNPNVVSLDEFHAHPDRRLVDVIESGMGARRQPVMYQITTAGNSLVSPCGSQHNYAVGLLEETLPPDETFFAFIAHADPEDDWTSEAAVQKANPNYGVSLYPAYLAAVRRKATSMPEATAEYQQKHLNWWVNTSQPWLSLDGWRKGQTTWTLEDMAHEPCWVGIDLAAKIDLCVAMCVFPPTPGRSSWRAWPMIWTPAETLVERAHRDQAPYDVWARQKHLIAVPGPVSDRV
jgi:phage terminase large subunit-like protein